MCWEYIKRNGKPTKFPINPGNGRAADTTDRSTWGTFEEAVARLHTNDQYAGVGFVFSPDDPYVGVDLDDCIGDDGQVVPVAWEIIDELCSYSETSPSGQGVKVFLRAVKPDGSGSRSKAIAGFRETEVYDRGRFFAVTGRWVEGTPDTLYDRQQQLNDLCARLWPPKAPRTKRPASAGGPDDDKVIERARSFANAPKFEALFDRGDAAPYGGDDSSADEALCCILAFLTRDAAQIERIMSRSALGQREKWQARADYRERTIKAALEFVSPPEPVKGKGRGQRGKKGPLAAATAAAGTGEEFPCTDLGNAERFADRCQDRLRYCHALGVWFVWDGTRWREDRVGMPMWLAGETARSMLGEAEQCEDDGRRKELSEWAVESEHRSRLEAMVALARSQRALAVTVDQLDADQWVFNTLSGTIDLRTGELRPHRREDLITRVAPVRYDPKAACPLWGAFLLRIMGGDTSLIDYLARFFGYGLSGGIELQYLPILHGVGANGKSVYTDTIKGVMGDYAADAPPSLLVKSGRDEHPTEIADLLGRRLVIASETEDGASFKMQLVKRLTGDATLKARRMRQDFFEFSRTHKTVMVTNNRPRVREDSEAVWRRLHLVPFNVVIPKEERDPKLLEKLLAEWPGILAWLVRGCIECQRDGLKPPQAVLAATAEYRGVEDAVGRFIEERCIEDPKEFSLEERSMTPWKQLYDAYVKWCDDCGEKAMNGRRFGDALDKRGITSDTQRVGGKPCKVRVGIRLCEATGGSREEGPW